MRFLNILVMLALLISGCAESDILVSDSNLDTLAELTIAPHYELTLINSPGKPVIRIDNSKYLSDGSEIGVFVHTLSSDKCESNLRWRAYGEGLSQEWINIDATGAHSKYFINNQYSRLFTYYPFTQDQDDLITGHSDAVGSFPALRVRPGYVDYLIGGGESLVNSANPSTGILMNHLLSYIRFEVEKKPGYEGSGVISNLVIKNQVSSSWVSLAHASYIDLADQPVTYTDLEVNASNPKNVFILAIPQKSNEIARSFFQVTIDGKEHQVQIPNNEEGRYVWDSGKRYTYRFFMNPDGGIVAVLDDFEYGGDWESDFKNPKIVLNPDGNADKLPRPTPHSDNNAQSRRFEIAKADLWKKMTWFEGASWVFTGGPIGNMHPDYTGCHDYEENGKNWRIPTYHELQFIYQVEQEGQLPEKGFQPLIGTYWAGNRIKNKSQATYWNMNTGVSGNDSPLMRYKIRCVRDVLN